MDIKASSDCPNLKKMQLAVTPQNLDLTKLLDLPNELIDKIFEFLTSDPGHIYGNLTVTKNGNPAQGLWYIKLLPWRAGDMARLVESTLKIEKAPAGTKPTPCEPPSLHAMPSQLQELYTRTLHNEWLFLGYGRDQQQINTIIANIVKLNMIGDLFLSDSNKSHMKFKPNSVNRKGCGRLHDQWHLSLERRSTDSKTGFDWSRQEITTYMFNLGVGDILTHPRLRAPFRRWLEKVRTRNLDERFGREPQPECLATLEAMEAEVCRRLEGLEIELR